MEIADVRKFLTENDRGVFVVKKRVGSTHITQLHIGTRRSRSDQHV